PSGYGGTAREAVPGLAVGGLVERNRSRNGTGNSRGCGEMRPGRRQVDDLVAATGDGVDGELNRMHAGSSDDKFFLGQVLAKMPAVIAGERLSQLRNALLPGVEGLAIGEPSGGGIADERWRRQVALTGPKRDQAFAQPAVVDD